MESRYVFVEQDPSEEKTSSGIYLPESMQDKEKQNIGTVVMVSPSSEPEPIRYRKGDRVKFNVNAGQKVDLDGKDVFMLVDTDIYCTLKNLPPRSGGS